MCLLWPCPDPGDLRPATGRAVALLPDLPAERGCLRPLSAKDCRQLFGPNCLRAIEFAGSPNADLRERKASCLDSNASGSPVAFY
jgi:hypothetical protein